MKQKLICILIFASLLLLCACSSAPVGSESGDKYTTDPRTYTFGGSTSTGSFYVQSSAVAALWEQLDYVDTFAIEATTGSFENLLLVSEGADFALASSLAVSCANAGTEPFTKVQGNINAICYGAGSLYHFVVRADSDIQCIDDMKGYALGTGTVGSGAEQEVRYVLNALGITYENFSNVDYIGIGDSLSQLKDGKIDVAVVAAGYPNASLVEACIGTELRILEFSDEEVALLVEKLDWLTPAIIPGGTYQGSDEDIQVAASMTILLGNSRLPEEVVYDMTELLYGNMEQLRTSNQIFDHWSFTSDMGELIDVHPGAAKYLKEQGL